MKLRQDPDYEDRKQFQCPCGELHSIPVSGPHAWTWNGSSDTPTFTPSIKVTSGPQDKRLICHSHVTLGRIEFCTDSTHALAGQTVDLPDWPQ